jgi:hypothetical protein
VRRVTCDLSCAACLFTSCLHRHVTPAAPPAAITAQRLLFYRPGLFPTCFTLTLFSSYAISRERFVQSCMDKFTAEAAASNCLQSSTRIPVLPHYPSASSPSGLPSSPLRKFLSQRDACGIGGGALEADARKQQLLISDKMIPSRRCGTIAQLNSRLYAAPFARFTPM